LNNKRPHFALKTPLDSVATAPGTDTINQTAHFCSKAHGPENLPDHLRFGNNAGEYRINQREPAPGTIEKSKGVLK